MFRMTQSAFRPALLVCLLGLVTACEQEKSVSPLSPLIAGRLADVTVSMPVPLEPQAQQAIPVGAQPVALLIQNASTNGPRPVKYVFQVATDALFLSPVHEASQVEPGEGGRTTFRLPDALAAERTYYWRVKADDGANPTGFSEPRSFSIFTPVVIEAPTPVSPNNGSTLTTRRPTLQTRNAPKSGPAGAISYLFEGGDSPAFGLPGFTVVVPENSSGTTSFPVPDDLPYARTFYWRVRASDPGHTGPWSSVFSFTTPPAPIVAPPPPAPGPGPGPGPGPAPGDEMNLNDVQWVKGVHIGNWAVTSTLTSVTTNGEDFCTHHTKSGQWPVLGFFDIPDVWVEGNQIMIAKIGNTWYGGAGEWLRPGQVCKHVGGHVGQSVYYDAPPLQSWTPRRGETVGVLVSTPSRSGQWGTAERSNVRMIVW
jgi:hypothetical protein